MINLSAKRSKWIIGAICVTTIASLVGCASPGSKKSAATDMQAAAVEGESQSKNENIKVWGKVDYTDSYQINIDFYSTVDKVMVKEGQAVKKGEALVTLNMDEYEKTVQKLEKQASLEDIRLNDIMQSPAALEADIAQLKKDIRQKTEEYESGTKAELQILQNSLARINKEISDARDDYQKQKNLFDANAISKDTLDKYEDIVDQKVKAKIDIEKNIVKTQNALRDELNSLKTSLEYKQVQLSKLRTSNSVNSDMQNKSIDVAYINLDIMKKKADKVYLEGNKIVSNVENGVVQNISVINGSVLGAQNVPQKVLEIIDVDSIVVRAEVPEEFITSVKENDIVDIIPKSDKSKINKGKVQLISNVAIEKDGERIVKVDVKPEDAQGFLKPGYSVDVVFNYMVRY